LGERLATSGSSPSVEAIIARFIATAMKAAGGKKPGLTRTMPHEVCGYNLIRRVRVAKVYLMRSDPKVPPKKYEASIRENSTGQLALLGTRVQSIDK
jgi:hypothetical protein